MNAAKEYEKEVQKLQNTERRIQAIEEKIELLQAKRLLLCAVHDAIRARKNALLEQVVLNVNL